MTGSPLAYTTPGDIPRHGEFIDFVALGHLPTGKMPRFRVVTVEGKEGLGDIKWYGAWWCYVFEPDGQTIYEKKCLRDIAQFLDDLTAEWKAGRKHV
jgi:hypothetical protein